MKRQNCITITCPLPKNGFGNVDIGTTFCAPLLLQRNFHSHAASNKVWMWYVYIVHLPSIDPNPFTSTYQSGGRCNTSWTVSDPQMSSPGFRNVKTSTAVFWVCQYSKILRLCLMASRVYNTVISSVSHCNNSIFSPKNCLNCSGLVSQGPVGHQA